MDELIRYAAEGLHEKVAEWMRKKEPGRVLDVPSGQGALSQDLERIGFHTFLGDIERSNILYRNGRCIQFDLNHRLPFKEGVFDFILCVEGIEHIENPHHLIREFSRLVKQGGYLILTTPNVMTVKSRMRFLFYSYLDFFRYFGPLPGDERHQIKEFDHEHLNPIFFGQMKYILEKYGFEIESLETNRRVRKWKFIHPFIKRLIRKKTGEKYRDEPFYTSDLLLEGEILIFVARLAVVPVRFSGRMRQGRINSPVRSGR